jgi:capsular exopolysaccharide synthesis family protein
VDTRSSGTSNLFSFQLDDLWPILRKQWTVIALFTGSVLVATLVGGLVQTPIYRASALIALSPRAGQELNVSEVVDFSSHGYYEIQQFFRTQVQIIESRSVREEVIRRYAAQGFDDLKLEEQGADKLAAMMTVVPEEQSQLVTISVEHADPERAAVLANLIATVYSDENLDARREASAHATQWLEEKLAEHATKVAELNRKLHDYKAESNLVDVADQQALNTLDAEMTSLNIAYGQRETELVVLETTLATHEDLLKRGRWEELAKVLESPLLQQASRDYATAVAQDADLAGRYGEKHPDRVQLASRMTALVDSMRTEVRRLIDGERAQASVLRSNATSLEARIAKVKAELLDYQGRATEYATLAAEKDRAESFYARLSQRLEEVKLTASTQLNNVQLVDEALAPPSPYKPRIPLSLAIGALIGLAGGVGLALVREYLDDTVSAQLDVTGHLKLPFLGLVPRLPEGISGTEGDLFTHFKPNSSVAEAVRGVRAMIEMNPSGPSPRRILVTSSVAREGKTCTSIRLAISFAQMGRRVVVVDADLRRPRIHKVFGDDNQVGVASFLVGAAGVEELPNATIVPNLWTIYSGPSSDHPAELMASPKMEELLTGLEARFDVIVIDTPPSVALSDAVTLSRRVDGIVLVVKEQSVSRAVVKQTIDTFRQVEANIIGVILNHVDLQRSGSKYKYYYAYRDYYSTYGAPLPPDGAPEGGDGGAEKAAK